MRQIDNRTWEVDRPVWPGFLNHRKPESGKWDYGHALLVAGSYGKMGAAVLAARACLRTGAGLVTVHVPERGVEVMQTAVPEAMVSIDGDACRWTHCFGDEELARYDVVGVGPGLGRDSMEPMRALLESAARLRKPVVVDADGLNMLSMMDDRADLLARVGHAAPVVLTPHAKEFERLFGRFANEDDRQEAQREMSRRTGCVIVYKGHRSQISGRDGAMYLNTTGNAGMATAGSGDVLTGMITGILAQNKENQLDAEMCACLGVWIHGKTGDLVVQNQSECSLMASDIIKFIGIATI